MFKKSLRSTFFVGSLIVAACGGGQAQPETPAATNEVAAEAPASEAPATWAEAKTKDEKVAFMKAHVNPRMAKVFQAADPEHYKDFDCAECHGATFALPKDHLPKLVMKGDKLTAFEEKPDVAKFMAEKVVPEMASIMGMQPYDPATGQGFGCMGCHAIDKQ